MKTDKIKLKEFISNCFEDCDTPKAIFFKILCKLAVFIIMVGSTTSFIGYWAMRAIHG